MYCQYMYTAEYGSLRANHPPVHYLSGGRSTGHVASATTTFVTFYLTKENGTRIHPYHTTCPHFIFIFLFNLTYSRWTSSLPSCLWSLRMFPSLPGSRLTISYRDASSALLQLVNQLLNFTYSRSDAFRYERKRKNTNSTLVTIELTTSALAAVHVTY